MNSELELYVHIPFCVRKCSYCDFVSFAGKEDLFEPYVKALCEEIRRTAAEFPGRRISSVYIGGGTPSILGEDQLRRIVQALRTSFSVSGIREKRRGLFLQKKIRPSVEFSMECNPGTVDRSKLETCRKLGINRLSIGLQSSDDRDLQILGRIHTYADFVHSFEAAREAGFDNINVDLMQAIPEQSMKGWKRVLATIGTWKPEHISAYSLIVEEGTKFGQLQKAGWLSLPEEETEREMYAYTRWFLEKAGYQRYEISNYAIPGYECRHNIGYWKRREYLGLGLNASSQIGSMRWKNTANLDAYLRCFSDTLKDQAGLSGSHVREEVENLSIRDQMEEFLFLGLRLSEGVSRQEFLDTFHQDFDFTYGENLQKLIHNGLMEQDKDRIRLTDRGVDVSNYVFRELLA